MILVQEEMQEPTGGKAGTDTVIMIIPKEEPTSGEVGMSSDRTTMSLQVVKDSNRMSNR